MTTATLPTTPAEEVTPPITTGDVLRLVQAVYDKFCRFPSGEARDAVTLWVLHTHVMSAWSSTPRLAFTSPEPSSGKTRALEITSELVPLALSAVNMTPVAMWRVLAKGTATILIDEADTLFGIKGSSSARRELRAIINEGHRRSATVARATGSQDVTLFPVYGACALAGLGALPETIAVRSVQIRMRRMTDDEHVAPYRPTESAEYLKAVRSTVAIWGTWALNDLTRARPAMPVEGRDADVWEPLIAIADHAGEEWPDRARDACKLLTAPTEYRSVGTMLLTDTQRCFSGDKMFTADLLSALWGTNGWSQRNLDAGSLARLLAPYDVHPGTVRQDKRTAKGYKRAALSAAWAKYLPSHVTSMAA